jgi:hypothetical protein
VEKDKSDDGLGGEKKIQMVEERWKKVNMK